MTFQQQAKFSLRRKKDFVSGECLLEEVSVSFFGAANGVFDLETSKEMDLWLRKGYVNSCEKPLIQVGKTWAREDVVRAVSRVRDIVIGNEGIFPELSFACFRHPAGALEMPGRKKESLHCTGLAIDLDEWRGAQSQEDDFFFIERIDDGKWTVYARSRSLKIPEVSIQAWYFDKQSQSFYTKEFRERLIDISSLMLNTGLEPINAIAGWEKSYYLSEWWHFQVNQDNDWFTEMQTIGFSREYLEFLGYKQRGE
jgi:hypothetical protein